MTYLLKVICGATLLTLLVQDAHSQLSICGQSPLNTKIVGGQTASPGSWPWQVSLQISGSHFCGGSLINSQWVLTAAHCVTSLGANSPTVVLGLQTLVGSNPNQQSRTLTQIVAHPSYNSATNNNDIALLKLSSPVNLNNFVWPVCLAASGSTFYSGTDSWVTGWGNIASGVPLPSPQSLREVEVPVVGNRQCNCNYGVGTITDNMMCAGLKAGGKDSCQGDSGGPLVSKQDSRWIQGGITSFGDGCALPNLPGVYARVSQYQSWINSQITSNQPGFITFTSTGTDSDLSVACAGLPPPPPANTVTATTSTLISTMISTPKAVFCGQAPMNTRIVGGNSTAGTWPWMVSLQMNGIHVCGGTLVAVDSVLSSADCFSGSSRPSDWTVVLGRLKQNGSNPFEVSITVKNIALSNLTGSNVAVLHLGSQPNLSQYIQPICLDNGQTFAFGSACWAAGWSSGQGGVEGILQELQTTVVKCGNISTSDSICTELITLAQGNSGGPIMCKLDGSWFQAAVLTFTANTTIQTRAQSVLSFTKISAYNKFLSDTLGTFLSPASNTSSNSTIATTTSPIAANPTGGTPAQSHFIMLHLLVFIPCLLLYGP